ncbi:Glycosyltransferase, catalytic subunit of cellulose synthase and poly-beta-1,6-N-acetylglucosamine synthase [Tardiphaga sp. OK246]|nr:Glycosyltransferase, catalytic subunit of cellulose synthase and poly-beta-1,6-N-acetylglucosamine synthase [Tardiphaga sp. OK246]
MGVQQSSRGHRPRVSRQPAAALRSPPLPIGRMTSFPMPERDGSDRRAEPASELDCLRGILPVPLLHAAERRSRELNLGADQVLIQWGVISEEKYVAHLARHLSIDFDDLSTVGRAHCPLADADLPGIAEFGILPLQEDDTLNWIVTPRAFTARRLMRFSTTYPSLIARIQLTTRRHLHQYLTEQTGDALSDIAAEGLLQTRPAMSAKSAVGWRKGLQPALLLLVCAVLALLYPALTMDLIGGLAAIWFLAFSLLRLTCVLVPPQPEQQFPPLRDDQLPIYSVVVALYREEMSVPGLLRSLQRLDYPSEKLDIILVLEPDDLRTRAAVARARPGPQVQVLIAQATGPKTKPKALNVALPFVRGSFLTVFDAEDDPAPGQLRAALGMFRQHNDDVACVQAGLHFDNLTHSLLSRMAAVEYAGLFAVFLPGLVALGMPLPLGGTSNHFRTDTLRGIGGWDAYNVTEDADLGIRLARLGYRSVTIPSVTLEEAPIAFGAWLRQRSRWMKGWMQTWAVHMRDPRKLWDEAGARGFLALNIVFGGNILTSLAFTVLVVKLIACLLLADSTLLLGDRLSSLHVLAIACGFIATCVLGLTGLVRRGRLRDGWILALTPIYWGCLSIATWRALWQFWTRRHHWEKTEHGLVHRTGTMAANRRRVQR